MLALFTVAKLMPLDENAKNLTKVFIFSSFFLMDADVLMAGLEGFHGAHDAVNEGYWRMLVEELFANDCRIRMLSLYCSALGTIVNSTVLS